MRMMDEDEEEIDIFFQAGTMVHLQGLTCMILGLIPVLAEEVRGAPYSSCWSSQVILMEVKELPQTLDFIEGFVHLILSTVWPRVDKQVNFHLARRCQSQSRPFLPIDRHMFRFIILGYLNF